MVEGHGMAMCEPDTVNGCGMDAGKLGIVEACAIHVCKPGLVDQHDTMISGL